MGLMDKVTAGLERAAQEADKAFDKGKSKVGELQLEMQMDGLAKKLGYIVFDFYRGREIDQALRQKHLDDMAALEDRLLQMRAEARARKEADAAAKAETAARAQAAQGAPQTAAGDEAPGAADAGAPVSDAPAESPVPVDPAPPAGE